ncbi:MAG: hypothetical protein H6607_08980 [Flavobacteriales bacterium]|nr:hypothetical protein [Flavobacteriales bacterium]
MKRNLKNTALGVMLITANSIFAQDVVNVGINDENISVTAPELNHKVSVTIEDSTSNYQIDIIKLPKGVTYTGMSMNSDSKHGKKEKKFTSKFFDEVGLGWLGIIHVTNVTPSDISSSYNGKSANYIRRAFVPEEQNGGFYANVNIRNKERPLGKSKNLYFRNATNIQYSKQFFYGEMEYRHYIVFGSGIPDYLKEVNYYKTDLRLSNLYLGKKFALGYKINWVKGLSVEGGLDIGLRLWSNEEIELYNIGQINEATVSDYDIKIRNFDNPNLTFLYRLGVNYKRYTFNFGGSMGFRVYGSDNYYEGYARSIGFAYRF